MAFGALATPIVTLATVTSGASDDPRLTVDTLGAMVGRQTPILAVVVPLILVFVADGRRGLRETWVPALAAGVTFGVAQFVASNYISVPLTDIVAALVSAAVVVLMVRGRRDRVPAHAMASAGTAPTAERARAATAGAPGGRRRHRRRGPRGRRRAGRRPRDRGAAPVDGAGELPTPAPRCSRPTRPTLIIIVIFSIANITAVKAALAEEAVDATRSPGPACTCSRAERQADRSRRRSRSAGCPPPAPC